MKLELGRISITESAALALLLADTHIFQLIFRHARGDWDEAERAAGCEALERGKAVVAVFTLPRTRADVCVVTNAERTETTVMIAEEYSDAL